jgi:hypothetical protein
MTTIDEVNSFLTRHHIMPLNLITSLCNHEYDNVCHTCYEPFPNLDYSDSLLTLKDLSIFTIFKEGLTFKQRVIVEWMMWTLMNRLSKKDKYKVFKFMFSSVDVEDDVKVYRNGEDTITNGTSLSTIIYGISRATNQNHPFVIELLLLCLNTASYYDTHIERLIQETDKLIQVRWV